MDYFVWIVFLVFVVFSIVFSIKYQRPIVLKSYNDLLATLNKTYIAAFENPYNPSLIQYHTDATKNLLDFIEENWLFLSSQSIDIENKRSYNQQLAINDHKRYLTKLTTLQNDVTDTAQLASWIAEGEKLRAHLKSNALINASQFATSFALHVAEIRQARYQQALAALKSNPTNPDLHTHALQMGREYAESTRAEGVVTLFDETALANDIRAVTANAAQVSAIGDTSWANPTTATASLDERIAKLLKLKAAGLLSDAEFEQKRQALIDEV
jgi:hypothetical protein